MGFLEDLKGVVDKSEDALSRTSKSAQIKLQLSELNKRRQSLAADLGASLYPVTREDARLVRGRERLYDGIARIDAQREELQRQLDASQAQAAPIPPEGQSIPTAGVCPSCGSPLAPGAKFCMSCGKPVPVPEEPPAPEVELPVEEVDDSAPTGELIVEDLVCPSCGYRYNEGDQFCLSCGAKLV